MAAPHFKVVFIAGGTGGVGKEITDSFLNKKTFEVRVLSRAGNSDEKKKQILQDLKSNGAHLVEANLEDISSLKAALHGVDLVVSVLSGPALGLQINLIKAAKEAGVKRFVPSEFGLDVELPGKHGILMDFLLPKVLAREELRKLGLEHVLIETGMFTNYLVSPLLGVDLENGKLNIGGTGNERISISYVPDFARAVVDIATHPKAANRRVVIEGESICFNDLADVIEEVTGKKLQKHYFTATELTHQIAASQSPIGKFSLQCQLLVALDLTSSAANFRLFTNEKIRSVREYLQITLKK